MGTSAWTPVEDTSAWKLVEAEAPKSSSTVGDQIAGVGRSLKDQSKLLFDTLGALVDPIAAEKMGSGIVDAHVQQWNKAKEEYKAGNYGNAARRALAAAVPLLGPLIENTSDKMTSGAPGAIAEGITDIAAAPLLGAAARVLPRSVPFLPRVSPKLIPEVESAVRFADREHIPISAGTRTGDRFVKNVQALAQNQPIASGIATRAQAQTRAALGQTAERMAGEVHPAPSTPEIAGESTGMELTALSRQQQRRSSAAYDKLEQIENDPANLAKLVKKNPVTGQFEPNPIAAPVDMRAAKAAMIPILGRLEREMPLVIQQSSRGLLALRNVIGQDDFVPASIADQNLSGLKQLQRETVHPKTLFLVNKAVDAVAPAVDTAVAKLGPQATAALNEGRALTKAKYATDATIVQLPIEPVRLFDKLTSQRDAAINLLKDVASRAPDSIPALGRAYLEGLFESATSAEGKPGPGTALSKWNKLGDSTKAVLFPSAELRGRLNDFFTLANKVAENPNPSGTATTSSSLLTLSAGGVMLHHPVVGGAMLLAWPAVTKFLYSPRGTSLLMRGLRVPIGRKPEAAAIAVGLSRLLNPATESSSQPQSNAAGAAK